MTTAEYWIKKLEMHPHAEGGWYKETYRADMTIHRQGLPESYSGDRAACSMIYYLLNNGAESKWHKVQSPELWLWHAGGTLELKLGGNGERPSSDFTSIHLGPNPDAGEKFQGPVPPTVWQSAKIAEGDFVLVTCVVAPAFQWEDFAWPPTAQTHH